MDYQEFGIYVCDDDSVIIPVNTKDKNIVYIYTPEMQLKQCSNEFANSELWIYSLYINTNDVETFPTNEVFNLVKDCGYLGQIIDINLKNKIRSNLEEIIRIN